MSTDDKKKLAPEAENQLQEQYVQSLQPIEEGQMIPGRVIEVDDDYVYVDVGYKSEGKIPSNEFDTKPQMGETVYVILVRKEGREGQVIVSKRKADEKIFWKDLRIAFDEHKPVQGTIAHKIKGGYEVDLGNDIRAFLPLSKVDVKRPSENSDYVGVKSPFYIDRLYAKGKTNIVVSRRDWMEEDIKKRRERVLRPGQDRRHGGRRGEELHLLRRLRRPRRIRRPPAHQRHELGPRHAAQGLREARRIHPAEGHPPGAPGRADQPQPQAFLRGSLEPLRGEVPHRRRGEGQGHEARRFRRLHRDRGRDRGPRPHLRALLGAQGRSTRGRC